MAKAGNNTEASRRDQYKDYLKSELEAAAMYKFMALSEKDSDKAKIFENLVEAEMRHASRWAEKLGLDPSKLEPAKAEIKVKFFQLAVKLFGTSRLLPWLVRVEAKEIGIYASDPEARDIAAEERLHARALREMNSGQDALAALRAEHVLPFTEGGSLRAAVLGMNDGLISNFSLVMGVAGGTDNPDFVLLAGVAGLLAGAFSMAAGEYISMRSQRDVYEFKISVEQAELDEWPEEEEEELALIYRAKGLSQEDAEHLAKRIMESPQVALETMAREELGLDPNELGSPWGAAISSFIAFVVGAIFPILPYLFDAGELTFVLSAALSAGALVLVGGALAVMTRKNAVWGALRMLIAGSVAAAVTFGIGSLIGVSILS